MFQDDIRRVRRELEKSGAEKGDLTSKIEELNLYNDSSERELKNIIHSKQARNSLYYNSKRNECYILSV